MEFVGKLTKTGSEQKVFEVAPKGRATHLRAKKGGAFFEINKDLVIKRKKKDDSGKPIEEVITYLDISTEEDVVRDGSLGAWQYVCIIKDDKGNESEVEVEPKFYAQLAFMVKSEKGAYVKTDGADGIYVKKNEIQPPAFKKLDIPGDHDLLLDTKHNGKYYACPEYVVTPDGKKITMPDNNVRYIDKNWVYIDGDEQHICKPSATKLEVTHFLIDGDKIVEASKIEQKNGQFSMNGVSVAKKDYELKNGIVQGSVIGPLKAEEKIFKPHNIENQRRLMSREHGTEITFTWPFESPDPSGLIRVVVNKQKTIIRFYYADNTVKQYALYTAKVHPQFEKDVIRVQKFDIIDLGDDGIKIEFLQKQKNIAENIEFKDGKVSSYTLNDVNIRDIKWTQTEDYSIMQSYKIDGYEIRDIEWKFGEVEKCKLSFVDEDGVEQIVDIENLKESPYKHLAITYEVIEKIEDFKVEDGKLTFKIGEYKIIDAELNDDGSIGKCRLKHHGVEEEINLSLDPRFKQLSFAVTMSLDREKIVPLYHAKMLDKKNEQYRLNADIVQTGKSVNGVAPATEVKSVEQAMKIRKEFKDKPYPTYVIDQNGKVHKISDITTTYDGVAEFTTESEIFAKALGNTKIDKCVNGKITLDKKGMNETRDSLIMATIAMCGFKFGVLGLVVAPVLAAAAVTTAITFPIYRAIKRRILEHKDIDKLTNKYQKEATKQCKKSINQLIKQTNNDLKDLKSKYPQAEFERRKAELMEQFGYKYDKIVAGLGMLGKGKLGCPFDLRKKTKLNAQNYPGYLQCMKQRKILRYGTADRKTQIKENRRNMLHAKRDLDAVNAQRRKEGKEPFDSVKDYKKQLKLDFNEGRKAWGGIKDKVKAYKFEISNIKSPFERAKMVKEYKKSLTKQMNTVSVTDVEFGEYSDKNGKALLPSYMQDAMACKQAALNSYNKGIAYKGEFKYGFFEGLTEKQKAINEPKSVVETLTTVHNTEFEEKLDLDSNRVAQRVDKMQEHLTKLSNIVQGLKTNVNTVVKNRDFESAYILGAQMRIKDREIAKNCKDAREYMENTPCSELAKSQIDGAIDSIVDTSAQSKAQIKKALKLQGVNSVREKYAMEVEKHAYEEYARQHKSEFKSYVLALQTLSRGMASIRESQLYSAFYSDVCKSAKRKKAAESEVETYKTMYNIEENVAAEVYCEQNTEDYAKFIQNFNEKTGANLDANSELARCRYYAHCKTVRKSVVKDEEFMRKVDEKAEERLQKGLLKPHEKTQEAEQERVVRFKAKRHHKHQSAQADKTAQNNNQQQPSQQPARQAPISPDYSQPAFGL